MADSIFLIESGGSLVRMSESKYESEDLLQSLIADYPQLLAGDQIRPDAPRRWLLVQREGGVPDQEGGDDRWSVDHVFLDQDGVPTLIEVKRSSDTRIRREVVGQMLDYAANAVVYWPPERIRAIFEAGGEAAATLEDFLDGADADEFWNGVKTNLQAGKVRLVFAADRIPKELQRIIEFLNTQMDPAEVIGVEVKQYVGGPQPDAPIRTLVPRVVGVTAAAQTRKGSSRGESREWTLDEIVAALEARGTHSEATVLKQVAAWASRAGLAVKLAGGATYPNLTVNAETRSGESVPVVQVWAQLPQNQRSYLVLMLSKVCGVGRLADERDRLTAAIGDLGVRTMSPLSSGKDPSIRLDDLAESDLLDRLLEVASDICAEIAATQ